MSEKKNSSKRHEIRHDLRGDLDTSRPSPAEILGQVTWLMTKSTAHREWLVGNIDRLIIPPIQLGQCMIIQEQNLPIAYLSWANLTDKAEIGYINGTRLLSAKDWNEGENFWWMDFIAPFGGLKTIGQKVRKLFPDTVGKSLRYSEKRQVRRVYEWDRGRVRFLREVRLK